MKAQNKVIILLISTFLIYTLLFSGFIYYSISNYVFTDFYKRLEIRAVTTAKIVLEDPLQSQSLKTISKEYLERLPNQKEHIFPIENGLVKEEVIGDVLPKSFVNTVLKDGQGTFKWRDEFHAGIRYKLSDGSEEYIVIVSAENYFTTHHMSYLRNLLLTSFAYALLLIIATSLFISKSIIKPLNNIIGEVKKISSENLHLRLDSKDSADVLNNLTSTFNDMLNRLETSFETQKNFISNASHELNTPLTSIIGEADYALSKERSNDDYKLALTKVMEQADKLDQKTKALLMLAQTGFNGKSQKFDKVRVDQLILDVKETVQNINSDFKVTIDFSLLPESPEKLKVRGNEQLLRLAITNIVMNGCKYSDSQPVLIALGASDSYVIVVVRDTGIGIPENELKYIYDPYFRASNTGMYEGYGIGLPLSRNIILMHDGLLNVSSSQNKGTTVEIRLPLGNHTL